MRTPLLVLLTKSAARAAAPHAKAVAVTALSTDIPRLALGRVGLVRLSDVEKAVRDIDIAQCEGRPSPQVTAYGVLTLLDYQYGLYK